MGAVDLDKSCVFFMLEILYYCIFLVLKIDSTTSS